MLLRFLRRRRRRRNTKARRHEGPRGRVHRLRRFFLWDFFMTMDMRVVGELPASADVVAVGVFEGAQGLPRVIAAEPRLRRAMKRALGDFKRKNGSVMTVPL